ncbi:MAG: FAD:protein FMN transferase [Firmicutes bacterium]|nr:FAD:protein FMN transferase [Bacillota bacterium]
MDNNFLLYKIKLYAIILLLPLILTPLTSCAGKNKKNSDEDGLVEWQEFLMGTIITQKVYANNGDNEGNANNSSNASNAVKEVAERLKDIERKMTVNSPDSEVNALNKMAGKGAVSLSQDTIYVLSKAKEYSQLSSGAFDPTVGPLIKAWGISTDKQRVPEEKEIKDLLLLVNYKDLFIDEENLKAKLGRTGQSIDLGGIAKGYAGDEAIKIYKKHGIKSAYINLGGNVVTLGKKPDGTPWKIGIQHPRDVTGKYIGIVEVSDKAVITSGDYERYFEANGKRYHHILDPKTGYPSDSGLISATIITDLSIKGDALSTAVFVLGLEKGMELVESLEGVEGIFITRDKNIYVSSGLRGNFVLKDESKEFNYVEKR